MFFGAQISVQDLDSGSFLVDRSYAAGAPIAPNVGSLPLECHEWRRTGTTLSYRESSDHCYDRPVTSQRVKNLRVRDRRSKGIGFEIAFEIDHLALSPPTGAVRVSFTFGDRPYFAQFGGACAMDTFPAMSCITMGGTTRCE